MNLSSIGQEKRTHEDISEGEFLVFQVKNPVGNHGASGNEGIGLKNAKRRLDLLYGKNYQLDISEKDDHFFVFLKMPVC